MSSVKDVDPRYDFQSLVVRLSTPAYTLRPLWSMSDYAKEKDEFQLLIMKHYQNKPLPISMADSFKKLHMIFKQALTYEDLKYYNKQTSKEPWVVGIGHDWPLPPFDLPVIEKG